MIFAWYGWDSVGLYMSLHGDGQCSASIHWMFYHLRPDPSGHRDSPGLLPSAVGPLRDFTHWSR